MLLIRTFQSVDPTIIDPKGVAIFKESFVGGHHTLTVGNRAADSEVVMRSKMEVGAGQKLNSILAKSLIGADVEDGRPALVPAGVQAHSLGLRGAGVIEDVDVIANAQFVFSIFAQAVETCFRIRILTIEHQSLLILRARFRRTA